SGRTLPGIGILLLATLAPAVWSQTPTPPRVDRLGDALPDGALQRLGTERLRCRDVVEAVVVLPDGQTIVAADGESVSFWDMATGRKARELGDGARVLALSADGKVLALARGERVSLYEPTTGRALLRLRETGVEFRALAISADGRWLAAAGERACVRLWDL